jgi:hypothetical protein
VDLSQIDLKLINFENPNLLWLIKKWKVCNHIIILTPKISSEHIWISGYFCQPWHSLNILFLAISFVWLNKIISYKGSFHSYKMELWAKPYGTFFSKSLKLLMNFNLKLAHVALSHVLPCFSTLKLSSLHLMFFRHPYLTHEVGFHKFLVL